MNENEQYDDEDLDDLDVAEADTDEEEDDGTPKKEYSGRRIMCFVSKRMVPVEDTIDVEYAPGTSYKVHERYIHY
jgi:hypothetical protein